MLYTIVYSLIEYLNFGMAYAVVFHICLRKQKYVYGITLGILLLLQMVVSQTMDAVWIDFTNILYGVVIPLFWVEKRSVKNFLLRPVAIFGTALVNTYGSYILAFLLGVSQNTITKVPI